MANEKYLVVIGLSDEDTAHLRLLMRMGATSHLQHSWRWGTEDNADLVVVDPAIFAGQMARNRSFSSGRRCALLSDSEPLRDGELRITRPMKLENVSEVLNGIAAAAQAPSETKFIPQHDDFYELELSTDGQIEEGDPPLESGEQREHTPAIGLEELIQPDSASLKPSFAVPLELKQDTTIEHARRSTARSEKRIADSPDGQRKSERALDINLVPIEDSDASSPSGPASLRSYLRGNLLGGPAMIALADAPRLTLDPKQREYHSPAQTLQSLAAYCSQPLPQRGWRPITTSELARLREEQPAQPYSRLLWLCALQQSVGRLASHLDPGGRYRLKTGVQIERETVSQARIGEALFDFAKLNEIAAESRASMAEVFDVINAYDAIDALDVERRVPRHREQPAANSGGLFAKLRKTFGKR